MKIKDLKCQIHMPKKIMSSFKNNEEVIQGLPPYNKQNTYIVDKYSACPENWIRGSDNISSYFVGVEEDRGLWINFNDCFDYNYDVAIVLSIQGINPITGQKTDKLRLEQYKKKCPIHDVNFEQERYCPECKFKWPAQNYLATTGTPNGLLWIDGFKCPDGNVRQYFFTTDQIKGIAEQLIKNDKTHSIGIAFYISKKKHERKKYIQEERDKLNWNLNNYWIHNDNLEHYPYEWNNPTIYRGDIVANDNTTFFNDVNNSSMLHCSCENNDSNNSNNIVTNEKINYEIGAGALIHQSVYEDPKNINYWNDKPFGRIYVNYCDEKMKNNIISKGKKIEKKNGYMEPLNIGG